MSLHFRVVAVFTGFMALSTLVAAQDSADKSLQLKIAEANTALRRAHLQEFGAVLAKYDFEVQRNKARLAIASVFTETSALATTDQDKKQFQAFAEKVKATATPVDHKDLISKLSRIVDDIAIGDTGVFASSGALKINIKFHDDTSVWKSDYIRNGFDVAKPYLDWSGTALTTAALFLNSNGNTNVSLKKGTTVAGASALILGSVLQHYLGAKPLNNKTKGAVEGVAQNVAQLSISRDAYSQLQTQYTFVSKYSQDAENHIADVKLIRATLDGYANNPPDIKSLLDEISKIDDARQKYESSADFVANYTSQLINSYNTYLQQYPKDAYPDLYDRLSEGKKAAEDFRDSYKANIQDGLLKDFPTYAALLVQMRSQLSQESQNPPQ